MILKRRRHCAVDGGKNAEFGSLRAARIRTAGPGWARLTQGSVHSPATQEEKTKLARARLFAREARYDTVTTVSAAQISRLHHRNK